MTTFVCMRQLILFIFPLFIILFGCVEQETPRKINLGERVAEPVVNAVEIRNNPLWFGFDLRLGPKEEVKIYTPFLKYLEESTGQYFRIKFTDKYMNTVENLGKGITQFASVGTLSYVIGREKYGIKYLVSGVNQEGDPRYHAAIITSHDSKIQNVSQLMGKSFCFGSRMSTQGHLIPRKMMEDQGVMLKDLGYYQYTGSHINAASAVINGECDAGGIQDVLANRLVTEGKIKIIGFSEPYPSSLIAYNADLDSQTVLNIKGALLAFEPMGRHKDLLFEWDKTEMPLGFTVLSEFEINKVTDLAKRYGLIKDAVKN
jgi:phosphonate transport system substrate-binding protein